MFQSENVFLIGLQRTWNTPEYFPSQFALDRPRSVTSGGWQSRATILNQTLSEKNEIQPGRLGTITTISKTFSNFLISLTDNYQKICVGGSLKERSLARDLASENYFSFI